MKIYSIYILNKAGGLIYQSDHNLGLNKLTANDYLVLAGTLHGVHAIASKLQPHDKEDEFTSNSTSFINNTLILTGKSQNPNTNRTGLQSIETDCFNLYVFQSLSGIKFIIVTSPNPVVHNLQPISPQALSTKNELNKQFELANDLFKKIYILYSDYVMKDPFYSLDMPIKSALFDSKVVELVAAY